MKFPSQDKEKVLVTSALPYIHGMPHLGNVIGSVLPADVYSRFQRLKGKDVLYICASDAHGTMYEIEAEKRGVDTEDFVYGQHEKVQELFRELNLDFSHYGITDSEENKQMTYRIFNRLDENGYVEERKIELPYCENCERFLADRWIEGECPHCGGLARGDQCDDCGRLLKSEEIVAPYCVHCEEGRIEFKESKHLFFQLQEFEDRLKNWTEGRCATKVTKNQTESWLEKGLEERCISRDSEWGFPIPKKGYENKVFYVWFDAPIGYMGATVNWAEDNGEKWEEWWFDDETNYVQFLGKDNILFHTILFPAMLKGTGEDWKLADDIVASAFLVAKDVKFSKSRDKGIDLENALKIAGSKYWRYVLMSMYPRDDDIKFSLDLYREKVNNELNDSYGNLVHRVLKFIDENFDGKIPDADPDREVLKKVRNTVDEIEEHYENYEFRDATSKILELSSLGNQYFQDSESWKTVESDPEGCRKTLKVCANILKCLAIISEPILPGPAESIWDFLKMESDIHGEDWERSKLFELGNRQIGEPSELFEKITDEEFEDIKQKYSVSDENKEGGEESMVSFDEFQKMDLRVGEIVEVEEIEGADELYKLQVDVGGETKQSVAGLKKTHSPEDLKGRKLPVVVNLEPAELMGERSECMVLAADEDGKPVLFDPEKETETGAKIV